MRGKIYMDNYGKIIIYQTDDDLTKNKCKYAG